MSEKKINLSDEVIMDLESKVSNEDLSNVNRELYKKVLTRQYESLKYEIKDETIDKDSTLNDYNVGIKLQKKD